MLKTLEEVFKSNLRRYRGTRTQAQIAEAAGIPLRSYQHAESGIIPQGPNRVAIAKALGVGQETALFLDPELADWLSARTQLLELVMGLTEDRAKRVLPAIHAILEGLPPEPEKGLSKKTEKLLDQKD